MTEDIIIARPEESDLKSAFEVFDESIRDAFDKEGLQELSQLMQEEIRLKKDLLRQSVEETDTDTFFLIAKAGDLVTGTISYGPIGKEIRDCTGGRLDHLGELGSLYVRPDDQDRGTGRLLIKELTRYLHESGISEFCLDSGYKRAQKKWMRKFGDPYLIVKDYWGEGSDHMIWVCRTDDHIG